MAVRHVYDPRSRRRVRTAYLGVVIAAVVGLVAANAVAEGGSSAAETTALTAADASTFTVATGLDPGLVDAFDRAADAAAGAGHDLTITDGFRTVAEQQALFALEVVERGSVEEASRWVFPPERSMHVRGLAIDVGDGPAADWLAAEGARFGLCRTLDWEWWHFEWRAAWEDTGRCPDPIE